MIDTKYYKRIVNYLWVENKTIKKIDFNIIVSSHNLYLKLVLMINIKYNVIAQEIKQCYLIYRIV